MSEREPEHNESTDEAVWRDLVARLEGMPDSPVDQAPGPAGAEGGPAARPGDGPSPAERTRAIFENQPLGMFEAGPRDYSVPDDLESDGDFVPPDPPPLGTGEPLVLLAWCGAVGGPLLLLIIAMFWRQAPAPILLGTIALFVASAAYLLYRLPQHRDESDNGAAV